MDLRALLASFVLFGTAVAVVPGVEAAPPTWCQSESASGAPLFCDDFTTDQLWTKSGTGLQPCSSDVGQCYNPTDWLQSQQSYDYGYPAPGGDGNSWFVGAQANGVDVGYLSPQPFGLFLGGIIAGKGIRWYSVSNTLLSPVIDATGASLTTMSFASHGSSEGSLYDRLDVYVDRIGGGTTMLASLAGNYYQNTWYTFPSSAAWLSGQKFQFRFVFTQDSNTDSATPPPCLALPAPQVVPGTPTVCPLGATICNPILFGGSGCLFGGMGFWVDDVIVRKVTTPPTASFMFKIIEACEAPFTVEFGDLSFDSDGIVNVWAWDFGDGTTGSDSSPTHDYNNPGKYNVTLTVADDEGNPSLTINLFIVIIAVECKSGGAGDEPTPDTKSQWNPDTARPPHDGTNAEVAESDFDGDGIADNVDLCASISDSGQEDLDVDGVGDVCDNDRDGDGAANLADNCPDIANHAQSDRDADSEGDACDLDADGDAIPDVTDNCRLYNPDQMDADTDGSGDACQIARSTAGSAIVQAGGRDLSRDSALLAVPVSAAPAGSAGAGWTALAIVAAMLVAALAVVLVRRRE